MKPKSAFLILSNLLAIVIAGCATVSETSDTPVRVGMLRDDVRYHYGEPIRKESDGTGGENWYYYFVSWKPQGTQEYNPGLPGAGPSGVSVGVGLSRESEERAIHLSGAGIVIKPVPEGKVVPR